MPKQLHILLSAYACLPNAGTEPGNGWNWAIHLAARGIRVHVLTVTDGREQIEAYCAEHPPQGVSFSYVAVPKRFRYTKIVHYAWWQFAAVGVARALHRVSPFDVAHHVTYSSIHVPTQLWRLGIPTVFGPVGGGQVAPWSMLCEFGAGRRAETARTLLTGFLPYSILHRLWLRNISVVLATNSDTMKLAKAMGRPQVEPWFDAALPVDFFADKPRTFSGTSEPLRLLWVGRMVPRKALPLTLDMLSRVRCRTTLTIVGDGLPEPQVRNLIAERGLSDRVSWAGRRLNRAEMRNAYAEHDVLICPSLRDSCPPQLVEAMGSGLPVIVLDHHGARDLVPDGAGIKVPVTTRDRVVNDLAAAVDQYAAFSNAERSAMSNIGWSFARTLNYRDGAELFEALYRQVLEGSSVLTAFPLTEQHSRMKLSLRR